MNNVPDFNPAYSYSNIGNVVGKLVYAKEMKKQDGTLFGHEFLIHTPTQGSINVRVPSLEKSSYAIQNFNVADKPRVRMGLTSLSQFVTDQGKVYTNATSFLEMSEPKMANGNDFEDAIKGRLGGEVMNLRANQDGTAVYFHLVVYNVDKEGKRVVARDGKPIPADVIALVVEDPQIVQQFKNEVRNGSNIEVGYSYINKDDITYDEYGFPVGSGERIEKVLVGKLVVKNNQQPSQQGNFGGFGQNNGSNHGGPPNNGGNFGNGGGFNNGYGGGFGANGTGTGFNPNQNIPQDLPSHDPLSQQAQNIFGNNGPNNFQFGN